MQKQITEIFNYTKNTGNALETQKVLKEIDKHPDVAWTLSTEFISKLKNKNIDHAASQALYTLPDHTKHQKSIKWLKNFMQVKDLAHKLATTYTIMDHLKPEKQKTLNFFAKLVEVTRGVNSIRAQYDELIVKDDLLNKELVKQKVLAETTKNALHELTELKKSERPLYEEKVKDIEKMHNQIKEKRSEKIDLLTKQTILKEEIAKEEKRLGQLQERDYHLQIRTEQLKKEVARNAPEYKKEKLMIETEYNRLEKEISKYLELAQSRQNKIKMFNEIRKKAKNQMIEQVNQLVEAFAHLDQLKAKFTKIKQENETEKRKKNHLESLQTQIKDELNGCENEIQKTRGAKQILEKKKKHLEQQLSKMTTEVDDVIFRIGQHQETLKKLERVQNGVMEKIEAEKEEYQKNVGYLDNQVTKWVTMFDQNIDQMMEPVIEVNEMLKSKLGAKGGFMN